jgi:DNA (cytosine-5)-methyltransferase 1
MTAYYNEHDQKAAAWLRELIRRDLIAPGEVDERNIEDVVPTELVRFTQCHFFAGIGVWSYALRNAGWSDDRPVWTGSCPCQPFSEAGKGGGTADERHLWPVWFHLISQCRPANIFGEQVASSVAAPWLDLVHDDLEALGYAVGPVVLPAAGLGAPHGRHRIFFVADAQGARGRSDAGAIRGSQNQGLRGEEGEDERGASERTRRVGNSGPTGGVGDTRRAGPQEQPSPGSTEGRTTRRTGTSRGVGDPNGPRESEVGRLSGGSGIERTGSTPRNDRRPGPTNGFWGDADWLRCSDQKWRAVRPGTFPLADGAPARVVRLRGYGNAIPAPVAEAFVRAYLHP